MKKDVPVSEVDLLCSGLYLEELGARKHKFSVSRVDWSLMLRKVNNRNMIASVTAIQPDR